MSQLARYIVAVALSLLLVDGAVAQSALNRTERTAVAAALQKITLSEVAGSYVKVSETRIRNRTIEVRASAELAYYPMREESVASIYDAVREALPEKYRSYTLKIYADGRPIEELIPQYFDSAYSSKTFNYKDVEPLIKRSSGLSHPTAGLTNRHIALWQSHGRYYKNSKAEWGWQRVRLWETVEDLYTQSYIVPYIVPMLERAGATVLLPRERSMRTEELIIDNDPGIDTSHYRELCSDPINSWHEAGVGFAHLHSSYPTGHNPFTDGTVRAVATTSAATPTAEATWGGTIPASGIYSLYVSYATLPSSVTDAHYTVHASGADHSFELNQQMGDAMWICLGEFYFEEGYHERLVTLDNRSASEGVVVADAIKIGGGRGNIRRGASDSVALCSGYPRFTEGARYWLQWSGFSPAVYAPKGGNDDYKEDYMSRAHWVNALVGGSEMLPDSTGKRIPIDLTLALHSDAGVRDNDDIVGTLGIYCTRDNKGYFTNSISRLRSRDLTDIVMTQIVDDIRTLHEPDWTRRGMWDRAYYEARLPYTPTMLLELLSHQNFGDMRYGLDPTFRFDVSRAIYKGILRYISSQYDTEYVVQPLPINSFSAMLEGTTAHLTWQPTEDRLEPTALPDYYILYTRVDGGGFDTGRRIDGTSTTVEQIPDHLYSYRITAVNRGGESFDSETLSTYACSESLGNVLIINSFTRVAAPTSRAAETEAGFYNAEDSGVAYIEDASFIGAQRIFDRSLSRSENDMNALGTSHHDYEAVTIAGNTFDYPALHGASIAAAGYSFSSASEAAITASGVTIEEFDAVDVIVGKQRTTTIGGNTTPRFEALPAALQQRLESYTAEGGSLLVTGATTFTDMWTKPTATEADKHFAQEVLHATYGGERSVGDGTTTTTPLTRRQRRTMKLTEGVTINNELNATIYPVERVDIVAPVGEKAYRLLLYSDGEPAAVAYADDYRTVVAGFPFETITTQEQRDDFMKSVMQFLIKPTKKRSSRRNK